MELPLPADARFAVIGAGLSGLACADRLLRAGRSVACFDKGRGPGGRLSTRFTDFGSFDHGAQYFTVRDPGFERVVADWNARGVAAEWKADIVRVEAGRVTRREESNPRWVGVPGMNRLAEDLAERVAPVRAEITSLERIDGSGEEAGGSAEAGGRVWQLRSRDGDRFGPFDLVVLAMPPSQVTGLLGAGPASAELPHDGLQLAQQAAGVRMTASVSLLVAFAQPLGLPFDAAFVAGSPLAWIARNSSKPGRDGENWVLHGGPEWSGAHVEESDQRLAGAMLAAFAEATATVPGTPLYTAVHRWRAAAPVEPCPEPFLLDAASGLAACGDWCGGPRVEGAWRSGTALAERLLGSVSVD